MLCKIVIQHKRQWIKDFEKIPKAEGGKIIQKIKTLSQLPWTASVQAKHLKNYHLADFRLRVGNYRVLFDLDSENKIIYLLRVLHRSKLY
ncbi:hypothetical protein COB57_06190 [Candidatus Peregrinibacteria bacterium]|nr:MAG: hypothetical protein COB57_06190 [Candidatus Peregrinibacteria bacterium]